MSFDLEQAVRDAPEGGVVSVPPGTYAVNLLLEKPVSLVGLGNVVLDGTRRGSVLRVRTRGVVKLAGLLIAGGRTNAAGGGLALYEGELELLQCTLRFNEAPAQGGGGLYVRGGVARLSQCRFEGNTGRQGGAVLVDEEGALDARDSLIVQNAAGEGGGVRVREAGRVTLLGCTLADNKVVGDAPLGGAISLSGTMTRKASLSLSQCIVAERAKGPECLFNFPTHPGTLELTRCLLPEWCSAFGGDNRFGPPGFVMSGQEPYFLAPGSKAIEAGDPAAFGPNPKDLLGRPRVVGGKAPDLGAFSTNR